MKITEQFLQNIIKYFGFTCIIVLPPYAFYWKESSQATLQKGVLDDFERIHKKGKTLADIPQKKY
ncbi:hypothetical protein pb186bvf_010023 [Paramecium bursaria]